jgi:hypothetical protein
MPNILPGFFRLILARKNPVISELNYVLKYRENFIPNVPESILEKMLVFKPSEFS